MQMFDYEAVDERGSSQIGSVSASSQAAAQQALVAQGLRVFELHQQVSPSWSPATSKQASGESYETPKTRSNLALLTGGNSSISAKDRVWLMDELATLLESAVPLAECLDSLQQGHAQSALGRSLAQVNVAVRSGEKFTHALASAGSAMGFPRYVIELVRAGETTGRLAQACRAAAAQLQDDEALAREVRSALVYPVVLMASGLLAMLVVFVFVVPKFAGILSNPKAQIPWLSQVVLYSGLWLTKNALPALAGAVGVGFALWQCGRSQAVRRGLWNAATGLPVLGRWLKEAEMYRYVAMLALLTQNKVNLLQGLHQASQTLRASALVSDGQAVLNAVRQGATLSQAFAKQGMLLAPALAMVRTGERSGSLDKALAALAQRFKVAMQERLRTAITLLEPLMILLISVLLGGVMISVILAVTSLTNVI